MPRLGVNWGSSPDISGSTYSLGAALRNALGGGGNNGAAESRAIRDAEYQRSQDVYRQNLQSQIEARQAQDAREAADQRFKQDQITGNQTRAGNAADSEWALQDLRIKPAGVGVLAPSDPVIVEYDTHSKALRDKLNFGYRAPSTNPENNIGAGNQVVGGDMVTYGGPTDYTRGNALMGRPLTERNVMPGASGDREPVAINPDGSAAKTRIVNGQAIIPDASSPSGVRAVAIPGMEQKKEKPTAENLKAAGFVPRLEDSNRIMEEPKVAAASQNWSDRVFDHIPYIGRFFESEDFKRLSDAEKDMVTAVLRDESGATIGDSEFARDADKYFPRYGDSPQVLADKANRRRLAINNMRIKAGPALQEQGGGSDGVEGGVTVNPGAPPPSSAPAPVPTQESLDALRKDPSRIAEFADFYHLDPNTVRVLISGGR